MEELAPMIALIVVTLATVVVIRTLGQNKRLDKLAKMQGELQTRVLDRFGSAQEMLEYLRSEPGKRLLDTPLIERGSPYGRILGAVQAGIVLALVGVAFLASMAIVKVPDEAAFGFFGVLCLALGVGFMISAWAAHALSKSYGLINGRNRKSEE
jgi:hypothetical protein